MDTYVINVDAGAVSTDGVMYNLSLSDGGTSSPTLDPGIRLFTPPSHVAGRVLSVLVLFSAALLGNVTMCLAVLKTPHLRTVTNIFTINLAVTDLTVALFILPTWIVSMATGASMPKGRAPFAEGLCETTAFLTVLLQLVSISTSAGISLDRYFSICHPLRYPMEVTSKRVYLVMCYIWIQSTALAIAPALGWGKFTFRPQSVAICLPDWAEGAASYAGFLLFTGLALPFSLLLFSYVRIVQEARKQVRRMEQIQLKLVSPTAAEQEEQGDAGDAATGGRPGDALRRKSIFQRMQMRRQSTTSYSSGKTYTSIKKNLKTLKTVFIVVGAFSLAWIPYVCVTLWASISGRRVPLSADFLTTLLAFSNIAFNPLVFISLTRDFRFAVRLLFARFARCLGQEDAVQRVRRESIMGFDSAVDTIRLHSRGSCDSGVDMGQDNKGLSLLDESKHDGQRLRVPTVRMKPLIKVCLSEEEILTEESEDEVWSKPGTSKAHGAPVNMTSHMSDDVTLHTSNSTTYGSGSITSYPTGTSSHVHVRVDFHRDRSYSDEEAPVYQGDAIPLLAIPRTRGKT